MKSRLVLATACAVLGLVTRVGAADAAAVKAEVISTYDASVRAAENRDVDSLLSVLADRADGLLIVNGEMLPSREEVAARTRSNFARLQRVHYELGPRRVTLLGPDHALLVATGTTTVETANGDVITQLFAHTVVYGRENGVWRVLHSHQSRQPGGRP